MQHCEPRQGCGAACSTCGKSVRNRLWQLVLIPMCVQDLLRQQMRLAYRTGDQDRANKIMDRLRPDEDKEKLTQRMFEEGGQPLA